MLARTLDLVLDGRAIARMMIFRLAFHMRRRLDHERFEIMLVIYFCLLLNNIPNTKISLLYSSRTLFLLISTVFLLFFIILYVWLNMSAAWIFNYLQIVVIVVLNKRWLLFNSKILVNSISNSHLNNVNNYPEISIRHIAQLELLVFQSLADFLHIDKVGSCFSQGSAFYHRSFMNSSIWIWDNEILYAFPLLKLISHHFIRVIFW